MKVVLDDDERRDCAVAYRIRKTVLACIKRLAKSEDRSAVAIVERAVVDYFNRTYKGR